ncbi:hypothetical protein M404DRAFT_1004927, partial [Pisolithus tinctorius Marx 270]
MDFDHVAPLRNDIIHSVHTLQVPRCRGSSAFLTRTCGQLGSQHDILLVLRSAQYLELPNMPGAFRAGCPFHQRISA